MKTSEVLYAAADLIKTDGWWSGGAAYDHDRSSPRCAGNSILNSCTEPRAMIAAQYAFAAHLGVDGIAGIWAWNDASHRTAEQVVKELRAAAVIEAARETADERTEAHA